MRTIIQWWALAFVALLASAVWACSTTSPPPELDASPSTSSSAARLPRKLPSRTHTKPLPPPTFDARTPEQVARAACSGADGWRCQGASVKPLAAAGAQPVFPPSWTVPNWFISRQNAAVCASNSNSGTSATCVGGCVGSTCPSGVGPLRSPDELLVHRWGCFGNPRACPRLRQLTTITYDFPGDNDNTQPLYLYPAYEAGGFLRVTGTPSVISTGALAGTVPKNRNTPQLLQSNNLVGAAPGLLAINTTHPSHAFLYTVGATTLYSQPLVPPVIPSGPQPLPAEVDTWADLDSVTLDQLTTINLADFRPVLTDYNGSFNNFGYIDTFVDFDPSGAGSDNVFLGPHVVADDVRFDRAPMIVEETAIDENQTFANCDFEGGFNGGPSGSLTRSVSLVITGGIMRSNAVEFALSRGVALDGDVIYDATFGNFDTGGSFGLVYIETGITLTTASGSSVLATLSGGYAQPALWGPGNVQVDTNGRLSYDPSFGGATGVFLLKGQIRVNNIFVSGPALCTTGSNSTTLVAGNSGGAGVITAASLDLPCGVTGYGASVFVLGGASIMGSLQ